MNCFSEDGRQRSILCYRKCRITTKLCGHFVGVWFNGGLDTRTVINLGRSVRVGYTQSHCTYSYIRCAIESPLSVEGDLAEKVIQYHYAAGSVVPLFRLGLVAALGALQAQTVILRWIWLSLGPVDVVDSSAVLPGPLGSAFMKLNPADPDVIGVAGSHHLFYELMVIQAHRGQASSLVYGWTEGVCSEPGGDDLGNQVAAVVVATPAGRTLVSSGLCCRQLILQGGQLILETLLAAPELLVLGRTSGVARDVGSQVTNDVFNTEVPVTERRR